MPEPTAMGWEAPMGTDLDLGNSPGPTNKSPKLSLDGPVDDGPE